MKGEAINYSKVRRAIIYFCIILTLLIFILPIATRVRVSENKCYYRDNEVALYIIKYDGKLPSNFITKSQAKKQYGNPDDGYYKISWYKAISEGRNIGGGPHLSEPEIATQKSNISQYYNGNIAIKECDIYDVSNAEIAKRQDRGPHRLVYCEDGSRVFNTTDHYTSFSELTEWSINIVSNSLWIVFAVYIFCEAVIVVVFLRRKSSDGFKDDLKTVAKNTALACFYIVISPVILVYVIYLIIKGLCKKGQQKQ